MISKSPKNPPIPTRTTTLSITGRIVQYTNFSVTSSGTDYTKTGDDGDLRETSDKFNLDESREILLNGVYQEKGLNAIWISRYTFQLDITVDNGDIITVRS
jgi:hypothetical protein